MRGKTDAEILRERKALIADTAAVLREDEIQVLETVFNDFAEGTPPLAYLGRSLEVLASADVEVFAPGWEDARGCRIEHDAAVAYGVPVVELRG